MITLELLQEFSDFYFTHRWLNSESVIEYKLAGNRSEIIIIFNSLKLGAWEVVSLDIYYEWLSGRRNYKLESIGI